MNMTELSIVIPCLNEAETLAICIDKAASFLKSNGITGELIVADNGSIDGSQEIAISHGARVIDVKEKGYGNALRVGILSAQGKYVIMGDADDSYDFLDLSLFLEKLREGFDVVVGNRFAGGIKKGAMPFLHRYLGNPVLSFMGRLFFQTKIGDFHCGLRGFSKEAFVLMELKTTGMEFVSEMIVKASLLGIRMTEVPTTLSPTGRTRKPHLRTWRDGWRHLRFLLIYSPRWLFLYPGLLLMILGTAFSTILISAPVSIGEIVLDVHTLLYTSFIGIIGLQFIFFYAFTQIYALVTGFLPPSRRFDKVFRYFTLERGLFVGMILVFCGLALTIKAFFAWSHVNFRALSPQVTMRIVIPAVASSMIGIQLVLYSFFLSILGLKKQSV
jgi:glycosyltransferase involved in cell wall biosynthesis